MARDGDRLGPAIDGPANNPIIARTLARVTALMPHYCRTVMKSAVCLSFICSCVNIDFQEPISSFTQSLATANSSLLTYYTQLNRFERDVYLTHVLYDPALEILAVDAEGNNTGLLGYFTAASIKARADALTLLTIYAARLGALAGTDAPGRFSAGSNVLGQNLVSLASTFQGLSSDPRQKDTTAASYIGPVSTLVGAVGQMYLEAARDQALTTAINQAAPAVDNILDLLEQDIIVVISPLKVTGELQTVAEQVNYYNGRRGGMSFEERQRMIEAIRASTDRYQAAIAYAPTDLTQGIRDAHNALVSYANSPRTPQDLTSLVNALETFRNRVRPIASAMQSMRDM